MIDALRGRLPRLTLLFAMMGALVGATTAPAVAASDQLGLSRDGTTWSHQLPDPLFEAGLLWVPGDRRERRLWVRNESADPARLTVRGLTEDTDRLLADGELEVAARVGDADWQPLVPGSTELAVQPLGSDRRLPIRLRADFDPASLNPSQDDSLRLSLELTLSQHGTGSTGPTGPTGPGGTELPGTGNPVSAWLLGLAALLCGAGVAAIAGSRRTTEESTP